MRPRHPALLLLPLALPLVLPLGGCALEPLAGPALVAGAGSLVLTGRTPIDHVASLATGRDCSAVRLERGESWCAHPPPPPPNLPFCTRSLGRADCWTAPPVIGGHGQWADPPAPAPR
jgi:hypothetical protein